MKTVKTESYSLLDFGNGERLEQWGPYVLRRPDPTSLGAAPMHPCLWESADAVYEGEKGKGAWIKKSILPEHWTTILGDLRLVTRLAPYKHTGIFPEQQENWSWMRGEAQKSGRVLSILNLFAYTGGASIALAKEGHAVTHVDSSRPSIGWAKENAVLNTVASDRIRWMLEDAATFASKEIRRGKHYDGIVLDPPAYGHGPTGKTWRVERDLAPLLEQCCLLLSKKPSFILLNGYAQNDTPESFRTLLAGILHATLKTSTFSMTSKELVLRSNDGRQLETGIVARVSFE